MIEQHDATKLPLEDDLLLMRADASAEPESLLQHCERVAENMKDLPDWKRGSAVNHR
jgi:hypothetical protein